MSITMESIASTSITTLTANHLCRKERREVGAISMKAIPIDWIKNYKKYICQFSKEYGTDITDAVREEIDAMIEAWERENESNSSN